MRALIRRHRIIMAEARQVTEEAKEIAQESERLIALYRELGTRVSSAVWNPD